MTYNAIFTVLNDDVVFDEPKQWSQNEKTIGLW